MMRKILLVVLVACLFPRPGECQGIAPTPQGKGQNNNPSATPSQKQASKNTTIASTPSATPDPAKANPPKETAKEKLERESQEANVWIAIATVVQTVIAMIGGWIIWKTLDATNTAVQESRKATEALVTSNNHLAESNRVARESYNSERRPWLDLSIELDPGGIKLHHGGAFYRLRVFSKVTNHGSSPALRTFFKYHVAFGCDEEQAVKALEIYKDHMGIRPSWQDREFQAVFPTETRKLPEYQGLIDKLDIDQGLQGHMDASAWIGATVYYESQHCGIRHTTLIGRLVLAHPSDERLRFDVVSQFGGWSDQELKVEILSSSAD